MSTRQTYFKPIQSVIGQTDQHKCRRCNRILPWDQFRVLAQVFTGGTHKGIVRKKMALHPFCFRCCEQLKGKWASHPLYSKEVDTYIRKKLTGTRGGAGIRSIAYALDPDDVIGLYIVQGGRCAISGVQMTFNAFSDEPTHASVDRINSDGHYTLDNVQLVCRIVNIMKSDLQQHEFVKWCKRITAKAEASENSLLNEIEGSSAA